MGNVKILIKKKVQKTSKTGKQFWSIIGGDGTYYNAWPSAWSDALAEGDQIMVSVTSKEVNGMTFHSINKPNTDEILMEMMLIEFIYLIQMVFILVHLVHMEI